MTKYTGSDLLLDYSTNNFGSWFKQQRQLRGKWLSDVCRDCGMYQGNLSQIEKGKRMPRIDTAEGMLSALGLEFTIKEKDDDDE